MQTSPSLPVASLRPSHTIISLSRLFSVGRGRGMEMKVRTNRHILRSHTSTLSLSLISFSFPRLYQFLFLPWREQVKGKKRREREPWDRFSLPFHFHLTPSHPSPSLGNNGMEVNGSARCQGFHSLLILSSLSHGVFSLCLFFSFVNAVERGRVQEEASAGWRRKRGNGDERAIDSSFLTVNSLFLSLFLTCHSSLSHW